MIQRRSTVSPATWIPVLVFLVAVILVWPVAEKGVLDDWSYARTAQLLAETGHIHYNGWATAMLGWPLYPAALAVKLLGFSFTAVRCTTILEACIALWFTHRTFLLVGLPRRSAILGTLTVVFSPIFLLNSVTFMSDVPGLLAVMSCLFFCLRALLANDDRAQLGWIVAAALSNAVLGTARQIAWLGVLVMVPSTLWLCRRKPSVLVAGVLACIVSWALIFWSMHWFSVQPYIVPERLLRDHIGRGAWDSLLDFFVRVGLDLALFCLPVIALFLWRVRGRRSVLVAMIFIAAVGAGVFHIRRHPQLWLSPFLLFRWAHPQTAENTFANITMPPKGIPPLGFPVSERVVLTIVSLGAVFLVVNAAANRLASGCQRPSTPFRNRELAWVLGPFCVAYVTLLLPRALFIPIFDRYLLLPLPIALLVLLRWYHASRPGRIPTYSFAILAVVACYSIATTHDYFATHRASLVAVNELRSAGVPRTAIDDGWEYNRYTQLLTDGWVRVADIRMPDGTSFPAQSPAGVGPCYPESVQQTPALHAMYAIAYPDSPCMRVPAFAPVPYLTYLPPFHRRLYVVRSAGPTESAPVFTDDE